MSSLTRIPNVGTVVGLLANVSPYVGVNTVLKARLDGMLLSYLEHIVMTCVLCVCTGTPHWPRPIGFPQVMF